MTKKLGVILGMLLFLLGGLNILNTKMILQHNTLGLLFCSLCFFWTYFAPNMGKYIQTSITFLLSISLLPVNDVNSLAPLLVFILGVLLMQHYFKLYKLFYSFYFCVFCTITYFCGWNIIAITNSILLYIATTTILYIIHNDKT